MHRLLSSSSATSALMGMTDPAAMQGLAAGLAPQATPAADAGPSFDSVLADAAATAPIAGLADTPDQQTPKLDATLRAALPAAPAPKYIPAELAEFQQADVLPGEEAETPDVANPYADLKLVETPPAMTVSTGIASAGSDLLAQDVPSDDLDEDAAGYFAQPDTQAPQSETPPMVETALPVSPIVADAPVTGPLPVAPANPEPVKAALAPVAVPADNQAASVTSDTSIPQAPIAKQPETPVAPIGQRLTPTASSPSEADLVGQTTALPKSGATLEINVASPRQLEAAKPTPQVSEPQAPTTAQVISPVAKSAASHPTQTVESDAPIKLDAAVQATAPRAAIAPIKETAPSEVPPNTIEAKSAASPAAPAAATPTTSPATTDAPELAATAAPVRERPRSLPVADRPLLRQKPAAQATTPTSVVEASAPRPPTAPNQAAPSPLKTAPTEAVDTPATATITTAVQAAQPAEAKKLVKSIAALEDVKASKPNPRQQPGATEQTRTAEARRPAPESLPVQAAPAPRLGEVSELTGAEAEIVDETELATVDAATPRITPAAPKTAQTEFGLAAPAAIRRENSALTTEVDSSAIERMQQATRRQPIGTDEAERPQDPAQAAKTNAAARNFASVMAQQPAASQVAFAIARSAGDAPDRIRVNLFPDEMGQVEVLMDVHEDRRTDVVVRAERPETVELLQRDARELQRALQLAGLDVGSNNLSFEQGETGGPDWKAENDEFGAKSDEHGDEDFDGENKDAFAPAPPRWRAVTPGGVDMVA